MKLVALGIDLVAGPNQELHEAAVRLLQSRFDLVDSSAITRQWEELR